MPEPTITTPQYCRQRVRGGHDRAYVTVYGNRRWLGRWNTAESKAEYRRVVAEWLANDGRLIERAPDLSIAELIVQFERWAKSYYRRSDGTQTNEPINYHRAAKPLMDLFGDVEVGVFGPKMLATVRHEYVRLKWCRTQCNKGVGRIRRIFRWGVSQELVPPGVVTALAALEPLRRGRTTATESDPVKPVPEAHVLAIETHTSRQVHAMAMLQLLTGMRPGEVAAMRPIDIETTGSLWVYRPTQHKTAHRDRNREILIGPRGQAVLRPFLTGRPVDGNCFSPAEAERERREKRHAERKTPLKYGNRPGTNRKRKPRRTPGERYGVDEYRRAIERACKAAGVPVWSPNQLRHTAATLIRKEHGLDAAAAILGHARCDVTQVYAELDRSKAESVIAKVG